MITIVSVLRDDAFELEIAGARKNQIGVALDVGRIKKGRADPFQQRFQFFLPLNERASAQILAIEMKEIENIIAEAAASFRQRLLQCAEIGMALFVGDGNFSVEESCAAWQIRKRLDERQKFLRPVEGIAGTDDDAFACDRR